MKITFHRSFNERQKPYPPFERAATFFFVVAAGKDQFENLEILLYFATTPAPAPTPQPPNEMATTSDVSMDG
jgi:hypothetical protein